ncbi:MAG: hypothetical protein ACKVHQ_11515 [Gammaproteobacteria bacterium]|jgi:hypothetical protein
MKIILLGYVTVLLLTGCLDNSSNENAFQTQIDAIEKAEEVEAKILEAAKLQAEAINRETE